MLFVRASIFGFCSVVPNAVSPHNRDCSEANVTEGIHDSSTSVALVCQRGEEFHYPSGS